MKDWTTKDLRKAAFAVGFGLYFGKEVARLIDHVACGVFVESVKLSAKNGNKFMQDVCEGNNVNYKDEPKKEETEIKMGFHM